jgi:hypothetical protein
MSTRRKKVSTLGKRKNLVRDYKENDNTKERNVIAYSYIPDAKTKKTETENPAEEENKKIGVTEWIKRFDAGKYAKYDFDTHYVFFKNVGQQRRHYDDFRFVNLETGNVSFTIAPSVTGYNYLSEENTVKNYKIIEEIIKEIKCDDYKFEKDKEKSSEKNEYVVDRSYR